MILNSQGDDTGDDVDPISGLPKPKMSQERLDELERDAAKALEAAPHAVVGDVVKIESLANSDYLVYTTATGHTQTINVLDAYDRAFSVLEMLENATGAFGQESMDKSAWLCMETIKAVLTNLKQRGIDVGRPTIKKFEQSLLRAEKAFKTMSIKGNTVAQKKYKARERQSR